MKLSRESEVVFDCVGGAHDFRLFAANNGSNQCYLDLERQAGRETVDIDFVGRNSLRLEKNLLPFLFREFDDFIFYGWTVPRPDSFNDPRIHRGFVQVGADDLSSGIRGISDITRQLAINLGEDGTRRVFAR